MEAYRLYTVAPRLLGFLDNLTNWYVRCNRERMKGDKGLDESRVSLAVLYDVLLNLTVLLAPLTPFITEFIYRNLSRALPDGHALKAKSVHFVMIPDAETSADKAIVTAMSRMQSIIELGRTCRERKKVGSKTGLKSMTVSNKDDEFIRDLKTLEPYILSELNVEEILYESQSDNMEFSGDPNWKLLGKKLGKDMKKVAAAIKELSQDDLTKFEASGELTIEGYTITGEEMAVSRKLRGADNPDLGVNYDSASIVVMDFSYDEELALKAIARNVVNKVQSLRKEANLNQDDPVDMWANVVGGTGNGDLARVLAEKSEFLNTLLRRPLWKASLLQGHEVIVKREEFELADARLVVTLTQRSAFFNDAAIDRLAGGDAQTANGLRQYVQTFNPMTLPDAKLEITLNDKLFKLNDKEHFVLGPAEATWL